MLKLLDSYNLAFGCSVQRVWFLEFSFKGVLLKSGLSQISRPLALPCSCFWGCSENSGGIQTYQENGYLLHEKFEVEVAQASRRHFGPGEEPGQQGLLTFLLSMPRAPLPRRAGGDLAQS